MEVKTNPAVQDVFDRYPPSVRPQMEALRMLILDAAIGQENISWVEETLKWGEPSYLTKYGSTVRIDWKEKDSEHYAIYFKCTSKLVPTFRELYPDVFQFSGNRAIVFGLEEQVPAEQLQHCIRMALTYHKVKHLPLLGATATSS